LTSLKLTHYICVVNHHILIRHNDFTFKPVKKLSYHGTISGLWRHCLINSSQSSSSCCMVTNSTACKKLYHHSCHSRFRLWLKPNPFNRKKKKKRVTSSISPKLFIITARACFEFPILPKMKTCSLNRSLLMQIS